MRDLTDSSVEESELFRRAMALEGNRHGPSEGNRYCWLLDYLTLGEGIWIRGKGRDACGPKLRGYEAADLKASKLENFRNANPGAPPLLFRELATEEALRLGKRLIGKAGFVQGMESELLTAMEEKASRIPALSLEKNEIPLGELFALCGVAASGDVYVQWRLFQEVDSFALAELERCFYELWYPVADDIELFDESMDWVIFVRHFGAVSVLRL